MKKMNKKGFTLAELLIVIAIIAILIAIAIPAFSGALDEAKLQTDHANIRSAYGMAQTAKLLGTLDITASGTTTTQSVAAGTYYFKKDGTLGADADVADAYETQAKHLKTKEACKSSAVCQAKATTELTPKKKIAIVITADADGNFTIVTDLVA